MKRLLENKVLIIGLALELVFLAAFVYLFYYKKLLSFQVFGPDLAPQTTPFTLYYLDLISFFLACFFLLIFLKLIIFANGLVKNETKLKERLTDRQELISIAAHELSAPLTNIKGTISVLSPQVGPEYRKFADRSLISIEELIKLIGDILTVSRYEMGKIKVTPQKVAVEEICQEVVNQFKEETDKMGAILAFHKPPIQKRDSLNQLQILVDGEKIREVIINLVSNALKYGSTPLTTGGSKIVVSANQKGREVVISVSDNGPGIGAEDLKHLFNRFVRLPSSAGQRPGTGLGLYISRLIVEAHGGKIWVESTIGKGTTFSFSLPVLS